MRNKLGLAVLFACEMFVWFGMLAAGQSQDKKAAAPKTPAKTATAAQPEVATADADEQAIRAEAAAFVKAYNAHDAKAVAALFALKAEITDEAGRVVKGRDAIEASFAEVFAAQPKVSMQVDVESIRLLTPNIAIEEGVVHSQPAPGEAGQVSGYVVVHVKTDGKWLVGTVSDFELPVELTAHDHLQELAWLLGDWVDESALATVHTSCRWDASGNFLVQEYEVHMSGRPTRSGTTRIGWNAATGQFQSWIFEADGGHATGVWTAREGEWVVKTQGITAVGETASATNVYRWINKDTFTWHSYDRTVNGEAVENIPEFVIKRRAPKPAE